VRFHAVVELGGKTATGLAVPDDILATLGPSKRPAVRVTVGGHTYRTTVAPMGGRFLVPLSADHRAAARVSAGDEVAVDIEPDDEPRDVAVPADLAAALLPDAEAQAFFDQLAFTHRKEWVRWVEEAKKAETRTARIAKTVGSLHAGVRTH